MFNRAEVIDKNFTVKVESGELPSSRSNLVINDINFGVKLGINNDNAMGTAANSNQDTTYGAFSVSYSF